MQKSDINKLHQVLAHRDVEYMIIGKGAAIMQGYSSTTQDIDIFPSKEKANCERLLEALKELGFVFDAVTDDRNNDTSNEILRGKDFVQLKGPFELDIVFAPDGFESYEDALPMKRIVDGFPVMSVEGIIKTKSAAGRKKDLNDIDDLRLFAAWLKKKDWQDAQD